MRNTKSFITSSLRFELIILTLLLVLTAAGCKGNTRPSELPNHETDNTPKCDHTHADEFEYILGFLQDNNADEEEIRKTKEEIESKRLVIASGGLRLRDKPDVATGVQVGIIPDGEIIPVIERKNGWVRTTYNGVSGWCSMEFLFDTFLYPTAGGAPIASGTVTNGNGVKLFVDRHCADKPEITTTIPHLTKILIYSENDTQYYVQYNNIWGYCAKGDILLEQYNGEDMMPEAPKAEYTKADLLGSWTSVRRDNTALYTSTLTFNEDGTVVRSDRIYYHPNYHPFENETDWFVAPMGHPSDYGYFGLDDNYLSIHYTRSDVDEYNVPIVHTLTIFSLDKEKLTLNDSFGVYLKDRTDFDIVSLCDALGVDRTAN